MSDYEIITRVSHILEEFKRAGRQDAITMISNLMFNIGFNHSKSRRQFDDFVSDVTDAVRLRVEMYNDEKFKKGL